MKKKLFFWLLVIIIVVVLLISRNSNEYVFDTGVKKKKLVSNFAYMLETEVGSGTYTPMVSGDFSFDGYGFNKYKSGCENGGVLEYDGENDKVFFEGVFADKCYLYFDKVTLTCVSEITISKEYDGLPLQLKDYPVENLFQYTISDNSAVKKIKVVGINETDEFFYVPNSNQTISTDGSQTNIGNGFGGIVTLYFENGLSCKISLSLKVISSTPIP